VLALHGFQISVDLAVFCKVSIQSIQKTFWKCKKHYAWQNIQRYWQHNSAVGYFKLPFQHDYVFGSCTTQVMQWKPYWCEVVEAIIISPTLMWHIKCRYWRHGLIQSSTILETILYGIYLFLLYRFEKVYFQFLQYQNYKCNIPLYW